MKLAMILIPVLAATTLGTTASHSSATDVSTDTLSTAGFSSTLA
jgi:hypothetical protein